MWELWKELYRRATDALLPAVPRGERDIIGPPVETVQSLESTPVLMGSYEFADCPYCKVERFCEVKKNTIKDDYGRGFVLHHLECDACKTTFPGPTTTEMYWIVDKGGRFGMRGTRVAGPYQTWAHAREDLPGMEGRFLEIEKGEAIVST